MHHSGIEKRKRGRREKPRFFLKGNKGRVFVGKEGEAGERER